MTGASRAVEGLGLRNHPAPFSPLFSDLPRRVLLGNSSSAFSRREADKEGRYVEESDDGKPSRRAEEVLAPAILRSSERTRILKGG